MFFFVIFVSLWLNRQLFCVLDALPSAMLFDNAVEAAEIKMRRIVAEGND
jgi:hypothetical protein